MKDTSIRVRTTRGEKEEEEKKGKERKVKKKVYFLLLEPKGHVILEYQIAFCATY